MDLNLYTQNQTILKKTIKSKYEEAIKKGFKNKEDDEIVLELEESLNKSSVELIKTC